MVLFAVFLVLKRMIDNQKITLPDFLLQETYKVLFVKRLIPC